MTCQLRTRRVLEGQKANFYSLVQISSLVISIIITAIMIVTASPLILVNKRDLILSRDLSLKPKVDHLSVHSVRIHKADKTTALIIITAAISDQRVGSIKEILLTRKRPIMPLPVLALLSHKQNPHILNTVFNTIG